MNIMPNFRDKFAIRISKSHKVIVMSITVSCYICSRSLKRGNNRYLLISFNAHRLINGCKCYLFTAYQCGCSAHDFAEIQSDWDRRNLETAGGGSGAIKIDTAGRISSRGPKRHS